MYDPKRYGLQLKDIPIWMHPTYRGIDWSWLAVVILCVVIVLPLATRGGLPPTLHAESEMYRILEVADSLEAGNFYPRWSPNFNYGYGSPLFNHIAPLPHYAGGTYVALMREQPHTALKALLIGAIFTLGVASYGFMRRRFGELAGLWGTVVLLMSPYVLLTVPYLYTDVGLLWVMAAFMLTLWSLDRALVLARGRDVFFLASSVALLMLSHTRMSPIFLMVAVLWGIIIYLAEYPHRHWRLASIGVLSGLGIAAFYLLPAVVEQSYYQWLPVQSYPVAYDTSSIFQNPPLLDRSAFNTPPDLYLGVSTWLWGIVGAVWLGVEAVVLRRWWHPSWIAAVVFVPVSILGIWLSYGQDSIHPNFMTPTPLELFALAVVASSVVAAQVGVVLERYIQSQVRRGLALSILLGILTVSAWTSIYTPEFVPLQTPITSARHFNEELRGNVFGSIHNGYLLPRSVDTLPPPQDDLSRDLQSLPPSTRETVNAPTDTIYEIQIIDSQPFTILTFDYPGWQVVLNNTILRDAVDPESGLISVTLNEGLNRLRVRFTDTTVRQVSWGISGLAVSITILLTLLLERKDGGLIPETLLPDKFQQKREFQRLSVFSIVVLCALLLIGRTVPETTTQTTPPDRIPAGINVLDLLVSGVVQNGVSLLGYDMVSSRVSIDEPALLRLYWRPNGARVDAHQVRFLLFRDGEVVSTTTYRHIAAWPVRRWPRDQYLTGSFAITPPPEPGTYQLVLEIGVNACDLRQLTPCDTMLLSEIYDLRGPTGQQILLSEPIVVYN